MLRRVKNTLDPPACGAPRREAGTVLACSLRVAAPPDTRSVPFPVSVSSCGCGLGSGCDSAPRLRLRSIGNVTRRELRPVVPSAKILPVITFDAVADVGGPCAALAPKKSAGLVTAPGRFLRAARSSLNLARSPSSFPRASSRSIWRSCCGLRPYSVDSEACSGCSRHCVAAI